MGFKQNKQVRVGVLERKVQNKGDLEFKVEKKMVGEISIVNT